jgi:hypothetical protein
MSRLADIGEKVLLLAEAQGFAPCQQTLQHLREQPLPVARSGENR